MSELENGQLTCSDRQKAEVLSKHYSTVFTQEDTNVVPSLPNRHGGCSLDRILVSDDDVENKVRTLKV